ncbi:hypothetical protein FOA52_016271 [Chlamydomonas sp. UWO 241]|nr:hypothetical protein FOA52_016271 [Chlamydomonas sp. UWO 241]
MCRVSRLTAALVTVAAVASLACVQSQSLDEPEHPVRVTARHLAATAPFWLRGSLQIMEISLRDGDDDEAYLLRGEGFLYELAVEESDMKGMTPGAVLRVLGRLDPSDPGRFLVFELYDVRSGVERLVSDEHVGGYEYDYASPIQWTQTRVIKDVSVLVMIATICEQPAAASKTDVERLLFEGPDSFARTLQGYYSECSLGQATLDANNSLVVENVMMPCQVEDDPYLLYRSDRCKYSDSDNWHNYAQHYVTDVLKIDTTPYKHRVLLMPREFSRNANCLWIGQGTLGPDRVSNSGQFLSSKVWLSGEYWNQMMAWMHEIGHTMYLHHAMLGGCAYCDATSYMGACCDSRCLNTANNWQLGWGAPLATLNTGSMPVLGSWIEFSLPAQHTDRENMLLVLPDWVPFYSAADRTWAWFIGYRIDSGNYDDDIPAKFTYQTNIYWWDGMYQEMPLMTRWFASIFTGEVFRNETDGWAIRQMSGGTQGAVVSVCRMGSVVESGDQCFDGIDNDCDGLIDDEDPDCGGPLEAVRVQARFAADRGQMITIVSAYSPTEAASDEEAGDFYLRVAALADKANDKRDLLIVAAVQRDRERWIGQQVAEAQDMLRKKNLRQFARACDRLAGRSRSHQIPPAMRDVSGALHSGPDGVLKAMTESFDKLYGGETKLSDETLNQLENDVAAFELTRATEVDEAHGRPPDLAETEACGQSYARDVSTPPSVNIRTGDTYLAPPPPNPNRPPHPPSPPPPPSPSPTPPPAPSPAPPPSPSPAPPPPSPCPPNPASPPPPSPRPPNPASPPPPSPSPAPPGPLPPPPGAPGAPEPPPFLYRWQMKPPGVPPGAPAPPPFLYMWQRKPPPPPALPGLQFPSPPLPSGSNGPGAMSGALEVSAFLVGEGMAGAGAAAAARGDYTTEAPDGDHYATEARRLTEEFPAEAEVRQRALQQRGEDGGGGGVLSASVRQLVLEVLGVEGTAAVVEALSAAAAAAASAAAEGRLQRGVAVAGGGRGGGRQRVVQKWRELEESGGDEESHGGAWSL